ncbi:hypothetical protein H7J88_23295 [Mycolicibacterium flavescens]|uniref:Membrane protein involved in the export of O-antigen and teichoic acid n=2 Tax=Mycolicibacterium flavescens TaxID=1776 RepID=A0A1E3RK05_MYCFV|nr:hypothetical protein [Mycolicibacterium flavescens]MCV7282565.1 hypothetical protein [Mycolicibacterium flavescens]ODQ90189.1 hypothetical protein BHQ18_12210 [Mycolicibacterium flavescens]
MSVMSVVAQKLSTQPLFVAQVCASGAGALAMVMAASAMPPDSFTTFALLILITFISTGAIRSFLFLPALLETRNNPGAHVHIRAASVGAGAAAVSFVVPAAVLGVAKPGWLALLALASTLPVMSEWLRMRGMALDERWAVARSDVLRLAATILGVPVLWWTQAPESFFLFVNITYLTNVLYLMVRLPAVSAHLSPVRFWRPAASILTDFLIGQLVSSIPMIVLGGVGSSQYIGGVRIAQTLLGPLNLIMAATWTNLMADGATRESHSQAASLIRHGRRSAIRLTVLSLAVVPLVVVILVFTGFSFRGADNHSLIVGTVLVGALALTSGFAGVDSMVLRLLGHHTTATVGRAFLVAATGAGYALGYVAGGVDGSLILGFVCAAVANPLAFVVPAVIIYRRHYSQE